MVIILKEHAVLKAPDGQKGLLGMRRIRHGFAIHPPVIRTHRYTWMVDSLVPQPLPISSQALEFGVFRRDEACEHVLH